MDLSLQDALKITRACEEKAREMNVPVVITVVDQGGNYLALHRMDNAPVGCIQISMGKAYTAAVLKTATDKLSHVCQPGQELYGLQILNGGQFVIFGGGFPLVKADKVIGALGVSGGSLAEDMEIARAGIEAFGE